MRFFEQRKNLRQSEKDTVIFYHGDCTDGFTAAWAAYQKFGNKAQYISFFHEDQPPLLKRKNIYTLDMTFPDPVTMRLMKDNLRVTAIDHHVSSKETTLMTFRPSYALKHSGCVLTWKYFFPNKPVPKFLLAVEDIDLWNNKMPTSQFLYSYLALFNYSFANWSKLVKDFENEDKFKQIAETGKILAQYENQIIEYNLRNGAKLVKFEDYEVYAINTTDSPSKVGAKLARIKPPFAIVWKELRDKIEVSLRGVGKIDCSAIAQKHGGGGHKYSAAFRLKSLKEIPWKNI